MKHKKISGVYKIINKVTSDFYIGSSKDIKQRWTQHRCSKYWDRYPNVKLYQALIQYGKDSFTIEIIEETDNLREREQYWIDKLKPAYNSRRADGLNIKYWKEYQKEHYKNYRDRELARMEEYNKAHRTEINTYYNRLCLYEGKMLTLNALSARFRKYGIAHPCKEAKKYLI